MNPLPELQAPKKKKGNNKVILIAGASFIILFLLVVVLIVVKSMSKKDAAAGGLKPVAAAEQQLPSPGQGQLPAPGQQQLDPAAGTVPAQQGMAGVDASGVQTLTPQRADPFEQTQKASGVADVQMAQMAQMAADIVQIKAAQIQLGVQMSQLVDMKTAQAREKQQSQKTNDEVQRAVAIQQTKKPAAPPKIVPKQAQIKADVEQGVIDAPVTHSAAQYSAAPAPQRVTWYVSTAVGNRVWITNGTQEKSVAEGEEIPGLGTVVRIDAVSRVVAFDTGAILVPRR